MLSTFGALNAGIFTNPRIYFAMAEDGLFFEPLTRVHARYRTPYVAVTLCGILSVLYVFAATGLSGSKAFNSLINANVIGTLPFDAMAVGSVFVFRRREKRRLAENAETDTGLADSLVDPVGSGHLETHPHAYAPPVRTPLFPLPPLLFVGSTILLIANSLSNPESFLPSLIVLGMVGAGAPLYFATIARRARQES
jgi:APA family basic amino acid/polyamine antiporter